MKKIYVVILFFIALSAKAQKQLIIQGKPPDIFINHVVAENETFLKLGSLYNVSPVKIAGYNSFSLSKNLLAGEIVKIPITSQNFEQLGRKGANEVLVPLYYAPRSKENLQAVSNKYNNVTTNLIKEWNNLTTNEISGGVNLIVGHLRVKKELAGFFQQVTIVVREDRKVKTQDTATTKTEEPAKEKTQQPPTPTTTDPDLNFDSDKLFELARKAAFDNKNYPLAIVYLKSGIAKSPDYSDLRIFLGRIYTWTDKYDSARVQFDYVIQHNPTYTDAYVAYADLEYWDDQPQVALDLVNKGLQQNDKSKELLLRKAKILNVLKRPKEARLALDQLLKSDPKNTEARALSARLRESITGSRLGVSYDYTSFDKQFSDPWNIASIDYSRLTGIGSVAARLNYANRFKSNGLQYELEAYPDISKNLYSYVSFAYSNDVGVFPEYRGGFSLYASLPKSFEGEVGFRYLQFSDATWIYTAAIGKYYKSWLFNARTYLTPGAVKISLSYNLGARYYYGGAFDFIGLVIGTGISPDERQTAILLNSNYRLISKKATATFKHEVNNKHIFTLNAGWVNSEYLPKTKGNQYEGGISYQIRL